MSVVPTKYDTIQDDAIASAGDSAWQKTADYVKPKNDEAILQEVAAAPATPAADQIKTYVIASGVTPNRVLKYCSKNSSGEEIVLFTFVS